MSFRTWTVLPHDPIEKLTDSLWTVSGTMPKGNQRRMSVVRLHDGRLIVHNAIALTESAMKELDEWGTVAALVVPNSFHRQDAFIWKQRYPGAKVYCPAGAAKAVNKVVTVDGDYTGLPRDESSWGVPLLGFEDAEGVLISRQDRDTTLIFNDAMLHVEPKGWVANAFMSPVGVLSVPRFARLFWLKGRKAFVAQLDALAREGITRVIVGHGKTVEADAAEHFTEALARLRH